MSARPDISYATVEAFERSKEGKHERATSHLFTAILLAVFFIVLMIGLVVGVSLYRSAAQAHMQTDEMRVSTGLLASYVKANDKSRVMGVGEGPEGRALVLTERLESGVYEMRIYEYEGKVVQEYSMAGAAYTPARAQALVDSETFEFKLIGKLLTIKTDQGEISIALRSNQAGDA